MQRLTSAKSREEALATRALSLTLDEEPTYAAKAAEEAFGIPVVPKALVIRPEGPAVASQAQVLLLVAALDAVSALTPTVRETVGEAEFDGEVVRARVKAPKPAMRLTAPFE
jgi:hypothetical protein